MKNREIYVRDPLTSKLLNDGVAAVNESTSTKELETLRYELERFVCEGQYKDGIVRILDSYTGSVDSTVQPAAWVSGFYGSGKSHLLKMLRHLWVDTPFSDGATARGLAHLPNEVSDYFTELNTLGRRCGGLHAASGTLPSGGGVSLKLAVLGIIFKSLGLPETLPQAQFCLWLKKNGIYDQVKAEVEKAGRQFFNELSDLYASPVIARAILAVDPNFADNEKQARAVLREQFRNVEDLKTSDFIENVRKVLSVNGQIPCTVIALDEIQLYIGDSPQRSTDVQDVSEALCKQMDSRILVVGAGQTALAANTPLLQRLRGRFTIPVELSDIDVEVVTRQVVLAKRADKKKDIEGCLKSHAGEISRQLAGTAISSRPADDSYLVSDYPILPVRRRFWEHVLRSCDVQGTAAQLRTQLRIVHDAAKETAESDLGIVIPADFIFEQLQPDLVRTGLLLRELDEMIRKFDDGSDEGKLKKRLCGLIFLIRKLPKDPGVDIGVRATADMLADLLVKDLAKDGVNLRRDIPGILQKLVADGSIIELEDGYALQTRESSEWDREFRNRQSRYLNDLPFITDRRASLLSAGCQQVINTIRLSHGRSKEPRKLLIHFGEQPPEVRGSDIPVWIRDGWDEKESSVKDDARSAGPDSPIVYVYVTKTSAQDLQKYIVDAEAARATIDFKGVPDSDPGREAREAMSSRQKESESRRDDLVRQIIINAKVFQGGGNERYELGLTEKVKVAAEASLDRLFPQFRDADDDRWSAVINRAKNKDEEPLNALGWSGKTEQHPVCSAVLSLVGSGKKGREIRSSFEESPYGWPRDAVDGALIALHASGFLRASHNGKELVPGQLDQGKITVTDFRVEQAVLGAQEKIKIRKLIQSCNLQCKPNEEQEAAGKFLAYLLELAGYAGGDPPLPQRPTTVEIENLRGLAGNEQLTAILEQKDTLEGYIKDWSKLRDLVAKRMPPWERLLRLLSHSQPIPEIEDIQKQVDAIRDERRLLEASDPVPALHKSVAGLLRKALNQAHKNLTTVYEREMKSLTDNDTWKKLKKEQREQILKDEGIESIPELSIGDDDSLLRTLEQFPLTSWKTRTDALPEQFKKALFTAAKLLEPKVQPVHLKSATLTTADDVKSWISDTEKMLLDKVKKGPVVIN